MPVESKLFTSNPSVSTRLNKALVSDPDHVVPGASGEHVAKIQVALSILGKLAIDQSDRDRKFYGSSTADAVLAFKGACRPPLLNHLNRLDDIVGKKTTRELDRQMAEFERRNPPVPPPAPVVGSGDVQIGPLGTRATIVADYYRHCGLETLGPGRIRTVGLRSYTTFEGLMDLLLTRAGPHQVIVNHGSPTEGLIVPWCRETRNSNTRDNIGFFAKMADALERGTANKNNNDFQDSLDTVTFVLGITPQVALRIAAKLVQVRTRGFILHLRACNLPRDVAIRYKDALRARMVTFHPVRLVFLSVKPVAFLPGRSAAEFPASNNTARDRARVFADPLGELTTLVIAVRDLDGHTQVFDFSFVDKLIPAHIRDWALALIGAWDGPSTEFVIPVMWDNGELSYHLPAEDGWRSKLQAA